MIDIGANLADDSFRHDLDAVVDRARSAGISGLVLTGSTVPISERSLEIARGLPGYAWFTAGIHPHHAADVEDDWLARIEDLLDEPECVAVGECGLDFFRDLSPRDQQERRFEEHLHLAARRGLPVFVHERDAADRMVAILAAWRDRLPRAVVHCFTGSDEALRKYLDLDLHIGITGWICDERRGLHLRDLVSLIPADRLMIETDCPYLLPRTITPRPKTRRNEPMYLGYVRDAIAACAGKTPARIEEETTRTAREFFALDAHRGG